MCQEVYWSYSKMIYILIAFLSIVLFSNNVHITFTTKLTNYNIHTFRKKRKMRRANKKYCSVVHNTCICIQTLQKGIEPKAT